MLSLFSISSYYAATHIIADAMTLPCWCRLFSPDIISAVSPLFAADFFFSVSSLFSMPWLFLIIAIDAAAYYATLMRHFSLDYFRWYYLFWLFLLAYFHCIIFSPLIFTRFAIITPPLMLMLLLSLSLDYRLIFRCRYFHAMSFSAFAIYHFDWWSLMYDAVMPRDAAFAIDAFAIRLPRFSRCLTLCWLRHCRFSSFRLPLFSMPPFYAFRYDAT